MCELKYILDDLHEIQAFVKQQIATKIAITGLEQNKGCYSDLNISNQVRAREKIVDIRCA